MKKNIINSILTRTQVGLLKQLLGVYKTVLNNKVSIPSDSDLQTLLRKKDILFVVALDGDTVVGGLTAHLLPSVFADAKSFYIRDIAVKKKYQRQGVGSQIIKTLIYECRAFRHKDIYVQTELSNKIAIKFFKSNRATLTAGFHFTYDDVIKVPRL